MKIAVTADIHYERGVKSRFGKYVGLMEPGWRLVWPSG